MWPTTWRHLWTLALLMIWIGIATGSVSAGFAVGAAALVLSDILYE